MTSNEKTQGVWGMPMEDFGLCVYGIPTLHMHTYIQIYIAPNRGNESEALAQGD